MSKQETASIGVTIPKLAEVDGLRITDDNQTVLGGAVLRLADDIDRLFIYWASQFSAKEQRYSTLVPVAQLHKLEYFRSFPHQAIFPVSMAPDEANLNEFADDPLTSNGELRLTETAAIHYCMAPAACFPVYMSMEGDNLQATSVVTVRSPCFRKEKNVTPLTRQTTFTMREVVCVGVQSDVQAFLDRFREVVEKFFRTWAFPVVLQHATDPFFNAPANRKYIMQKVTPLKHEMVYDGHLAIGSINFHQKSFGETFHLSCRGSPAFSGCVAFGLERWLFVFLHFFGTDPKAWPSLEDLITN